MKKLKKRWEASQERQAFRDHPTHTWRCLYCHRELVDGEQCTALWCIEAQVAAKERMRNK